MGFESGSLFVDDLNFNEAEIVLSPQPSAAEWFRSIEILVNNPYERLGNFTVKCKFISVIFSSKKM